MRKTVKKKNGGWKRRGIVQAARELGVSRHHLVEVIEGRRSSKRCLEHWKKATHCRAQGRAS